MVSFWQIFSKLVGTPVGTPFFSVGEQETMVDLKEPQNQAKNTSGGLGYITVIHDLQLPWEKNTTN